MIRDIRDHGDLCTWHNLKGERCNASAVMGSAKTALCVEHLDSHRRLTMEPEEYANWKAARDAE